MCHDMVCGGEGHETSRRSCERFHENKFTLLPVTLIRDRVRHLCWGLKSGEVLLLGGLGGGRFSEKVSADGSSSSLDFELAYEIM